MCDFADVTRKILMCCSHKLLVAVAKRARFAVSLPVDALFDTAVTIIIAASTAIAAAIIENKMILIETPDEIVGVSAAAAPPAVMGMSIDCMTSAAVDCASMMAAMMVLTMAVIVAVAVGTARENRIADVAPVAAPVDDVTLAAVVSVNAVVVTYAVASAGVFSDTETTAFESPDDAVAV